LTNEPHSPFAPLLRGWFGKSAVHLDFTIAAVLMIGYLLHDDRPGSRGLRQAAK
jgi:hypothetical protein